MASSTIQTTLTDFVYDILNNTMDAILNAQLDQERRYFEMIEDSLLSAEEFVDKYDLKRGVQESLGKERITDHDLEELLLELYEGRRQLVRKMLEDGPPKLRVQEGNINVKLAFSIAEQVPTTEKSLHPSSQAATKVSTALTAGTVDKSLKAQVRDSLKLQVDKKLQTTQLYRKTGRSIQVSLPGSEATDPRKAQVLGSLDLKFTVD